MNVNFDGIGSQVMTFLNNSKSLAVPGDPVSVSGNGEVQQAPADSAFIGLCLSGDENYIAVQVSGVITCPYTGAAPALGYTALAAGKSAVAAKESGREYLVLAVNTTAKTVTFVL